MKIHVLTLFPEMFPPVTESSILGRAGEKGILDIDLINIRDYTLDKHKRTDDTPYGGGYGMVLACQPVVDCLRAVKSRLTGSVRTIYLSPQGGLFTHRKAKELASYDNLVLLCGHYEGVDERILELEVDEELSVGDYVLTGGELPAAIVVDAVARLVDGVLPAAEVHTDESIVTGLLEYPQYTRPRVFEGRAVPDVLLGGDHEEIRKWRLARAFERTLEKRPELLELLKGEEPLDRRDET